MPIAFAGQDLLIPHTSSIDIYVPAGVIGQDLTALVVQIALPRDGYQPIEPDWHAASWDTVNIAKVEIGPEAGWVFTWGWYRPFTRVLDHPEVPVIQATNWVHIY